MWAASTALLMGRLAVPGRDRGLGSHDRTRGAIDTWPPSRPALQRARAGRPGPARASAVSSASSALDVRGG